MRKFIAIVFLLIYANVGLAMAIDFHFCNGQLSKISFAKVNHNSSCCCKTQNMPKGCCNDERIIVKADKHQSQTSLAFSESGFKIILSPQLVSQDEPLYTFRNREKLLSFSRLRSPDDKEIFLTVRNLRI